MARFVTDTEIARLKQADEHSFQKRLYAAMRDRVYRNTKVLGLVQPEDTQEWWHLCWERVSDAAFVWHMERDEKLGQWLRHVALWLRDLPDTEWIGPWFRNHDRPLVGQLETAHVSLAMCELLDLCGPLFTAEETAGMKQALRVKGMEACRRYCEQITAERSHINNWYAVQLSAFGVCALCLEDDAAAEQLILLLPDAYSLFNTDSYGESMQYSNYAVLMLSFLHEIVLRLRPDLADSISPECYGRLMTWYAAGFLYMKKWDDKDDTLWPRTFNFADSAAVFRPTGSVLVQVAARCGRTLPRQAALASWLFETTYAHPEQGPDELATFGFYPNFNYHAVLMEPDRVPALDPAQLNLCEAETFENGQTFIRDSYTDTRAALAVQAGYASLNVASHRHQDHGSIQFAQGTERMIIDGGHCCYRLNAQQFSASTKQHATMDFIRIEPHQRVWNEPFDPFEGIEQQQCAEGNFYRRRDPLVTNLMNRCVGSAHVLVMDMTKAYGEHVSRARRAIVSVLPGAVFILDAATTSCMLRMQAHFPMNNRDGKLQTHQADEHRFVFRRNGEALKLFECLCLVDAREMPSAMGFDWGYCHRNYHPLEGQEGQAKEGSAEIYTWTDREEGLEHLRICAIASDRDERITGWHIKPDELGRWYIETPEHEKLLMLRVDGHSVYLVQGDAETQIL